MTFKQLIGFYRLHPCDPHSFNSESTLTGNHYLDFPSIDKKRAELKKSIEERFRQVQNSPWEQLSIFETLTEAISTHEQFKLEIEPGVNLSGIPMNDWSMYCTGSVISQSTHFTTLQSLHLENCAIQLSHMQALEVGLCRFNRGEFQVREKVEIFPRSNMNTRSCRITHSARYIIF